MARILVVEDDASLLKAVARVLTDLGHEIHAAPSAAAAIAAAAEFKPDLLLTDWLLRERRGIDVALALRPMVPDVQTLFITGLPADSIREQARQVSPWPVLQKPVDLDAVEAAVNEALADHKPLSTRPPKPVHRGGKHRASR